MKYPQDKYNHDVWFRKLVDTIKAYLHHSDFTPSEVRQAAILACIQFEMERAHPSILIPKEVDEALSILEKWAT